MLTVVRDAQGQLLVACEWWLVNDLGQQDWGAGRYVWVEQMELTPGMGRAALAGLIARIAALVPQAVGAYWVRRETTDQRLHAYRRNQLVKEVQV